MNTWILILLLLLLVAFGLMFRVRELFEDVEAEVEAEAPDLDQIDLLHSSSKKKNRSFFRTPRTYSHDLTLTREFDTLPGLKEGFVDDSDRKHRCPVCPDMSKYIRLDEVPCWNCSLP